MSNLNINENEAARLPGDLQRKDPDLVKVVRCKDCARYGGAEFGYICGRWSGLCTKNYTKPDDFCSYGERRAENE